MIYFFLLPSIYYILLLFPIYRDVRKSSSIDKYLTNQGLEEKRHQALLSFNRIITSVSDHAIKVTTAVIASYYAFNPQRPSGTFGKIMIIIVITGFLIWLCYINIRLISIVFKELMNLRSQRLFFYLASAVILQITIFHLFFIDVDFGLWFFSFALHLSFVRFGRDSLRARLLVDGGYFTSTEYIPASREDSASGAVIDFIRMLSFVCLLLPFLFHDLYWIESSIPVPMFNISGAKVGAFSAVGMKIKVCYLVEFLINLWFVFSVIRCIKDLSRKVNIIMRGIFLAHISSFFIFIAYRFTMDFHTLYFLRSLGSFAVILATYIVLRQRITHDEWSSYLKEDNGVPTVYLTFSVLFIFACLILFSGFRILPSAMFFAGPISATLILSLALIRYRISRVVPPKIELPLGDVNKKFFRVYFPQDEHQDRLVIKLMANCKVNSEFAHQATVTLKGEEIEARVDKEIGEIHFVVEGYKLNAPGTKIDIEFSFHNKEDTMIYFEQYTW